MQHIFSRKRWQVGGALASLGRSSAGVVADWRICPTGGKLPEKERTERCVKSHLQLGSYGLFRTRKRWSRVFPLRVTQVAPCWRPILGRESYCIGASGYIYCCWRVSVGESG